MPRSGPASPVSWGQSRLRRAGRADRLWRGRRDRGGVRRAANRPFFAFAFIIGAYSLANAIPVFATLAASLTTQAVIGAP